MGSGPDLPDPQPDELLIRNHASSVNPIDCMRRRGYGHKLLSLAGAANFPLILGNDFAGTVEAVPQNPSVNNPHNLQPGDRVFGALPPASKGTYAAYCLAKPQWLIPIPDDWSFEQAASIPYAALTGIAALKDLRLTASSTSGKKVLIQGGSGGVGSFCIQLLAHWGAEVTTLSSRKNQQYCLELGAQHALDYNRVLPGTLTGFDAVLAAFGFENTPHFHPRLLVRGGRYTTLKHPLLAWSDKFGVLPGAVAAAGLYGKRKLKWARSGRSYTWTLFSIDANRMQLLSEALQHSNIAPCLQQTVPLSEISRAHELSETQRVRGKIVLDISA
ncbi:MAG: NAD(P)-dependent alcohol dehydrogenase [Gammaproteobacteria bacterium]